MPVFPIERRMDAQLATSRLDEAFQKLLLRFSATASQGIDFASLIRLFCVTTREFFKASGAYYWKLTDGVLHGVDADGHLAERFVGARLRLDESAVAVRSVRDRRAVYVNGLDSSVYPMAADFEARSIMSAPLVVAGDVIRAVVFLHRTDPDFFNDDLADKATILAAELGTLVEASCLTEALREERRRAEVLVQCAHVLHGSLDGEAVLNTLAEHVRMLFRARLAAVVVQAGSQQSIKALASDPPELAEQVRERHGEEGSAWFDELLRQACYFAKPDPV